jgi:hypothetical protein
MDGPWQYIGAVREVYLVDKSDVSALFNPHNWVKSLIVWKMFAFVKA